MKVPNLTPVSVKCCGDNVHRCMLFKSGAVYSEQIAVVWDFDLVADKGHIFFFTDDRGCNTMCDLVLLAFDCIHYDWHFRYSSCPQNTSYLTWNMISSEV